MEHRNDFGSRLARLEERDKADAEKIRDMKVDIKTLTNRLNWLILVLAANFGVTFLKLLHAGP